MIHALWFALPLSFVAGLMGAIAGGGGTLTLPTLMLIEKDVLVCISTNKLLAFLTTLPSSLVFLNEGLFKFKRWKLCTIFSILGSLVGTVCAVRTPPWILEALIPVVVVSTALYSALGSEGTNRDERKLNPSLFVWLSVVAGFLLGFYGSFIGAGIGILWHIVLKRGFWQDSLSAVAISRVLCFTNNSIAFFSYIGVGHINYSLGFAMGAVMMVGSYAGARVALSFGQRAIKLGMLGVASIMSVQIIISHLSN